MIENVVYGLVTRYAVVDKRLPSWYGHGNVHRNPESHIHWNTICSSHGVSYCVWLCTTQPMLPILQSPNSSLISLSPLSLLFYNFTNVFVYKLCINSYLLDKFLSGSKKVNANLFWLTVSLLIHFISFQSLFFFPLIL